jgi:hypothetical protein
MEFTGNEKRRAYAGIVATTPAIVLLLLVEITNCFHWDRSSFYFLVVYNGTILVLIGALFLSFNFLKQQKLKITSYGIEYYIGRKLKFSESWKNIREIGVTPVPAGYMYIFIWHINIYFKSKNGKSIPLTAAAFFNTREEFKSAMKEIIFNALNSGNPEIWDPFNLAGTKEILIEYAKTKHLPIDEYKLNKEYISIPYWTRFRNIVIGFLFILVLGVFLIYLAMLFNQFSLILGSFSLLGILFGILGLYLSYDVYKVYINRIVIYPSFLEVYLRKDPEKSISIRYDEIKEILLSTKGHIGDISIRLSKTDYVQGSFDIDVATEIRNLWLNWKGKREERGNTD